MRVQAGGQVAQGVAGVERAGWVGEQGVQVDPVVVGLLQGLGEGGPVGVLGQGGV